MLRSFKARLLIVILIITIVSMGMQLNQSTKEIIVPVLSFILKDYEVEKKAALLWENLGLQPARPVIPVMTEPFAVPCESYEIEKSYGWYWNQDTNRQEFLPGIRLSVPNNSLIKAAKEGTVVEIAVKNEERSVLIKHTDNLYSYYEGLKEVLVDLNSQVKQGEVLGKSSGYLYFELRSEDGPLNPASIFK